MFFKILRQANRSTLLLLAIFITLYLVVNFKHGVTVAPAYQLGMFGGKFKMADTQTVIRIVVNNVDTLNFSELDVVQRDRLVYAIEKQDQYQANNKQVHATMYRVFNKAALGFLADGSNLVYEPDSLVVNQRLARLLQGFIKKRIMQVTIYFQDFAIINNNIQPVSELRSAHSFAVTE